MIKRKPITLSAAELVRESQLLANSKLPLLFQPAVEGVQLSSWGQQNRALIESRLCQRGAILFRGFTASVDAFEEFMTMLTGGLLEYGYRSTPRTQVSGRIYTSTEYPAHQTIPQHNEMSYSRRWPMILGFYCVEPAAEGGETPLADSRRVYARLDAEVRERFARSEIMYVRNYGQSLDLPWQDVFQTSERAVVEDYCREAGIDFEWRDGDRLRTRQVCQAVANHPQTNESVWFNQAHLFHISHLPGEIRQSLLDAAGELPRDACFGDGSPITEADLTEIRAAYDAETIAFAWQKGDVLVVDNMLVAHGRRPYRGARRVVVGMGRPHSDQNSDHTSAESGLAADL
jgi:alpha-ketoglutarate-dependent taurine dioxygenase